MRITGFILLAGFCFFAAGCSENELKGSVEVVSKAGETTSMTPVKCFSGDREDFFGADLREASGSKHVRVIKDPKGGNAAMINLSGGKPVMVNQGMCERFDVQVSTENARVNRVKEVHGSLVLACKVAGATVKANVTFRNCH